MTARIVDKPKFRPGKCVITGTNKGPFLDTGRDIAGYGRVYIALDSNQSILKKAGYITKDDVKHLKKKLEEARQRVKELEPDAAEYQKIMDALINFMPDVEPEVREVEVVKPRDPTDKEIAEWIHKYGIDHPVIKSALPPEPGSTEEWNRLYRDAKTKPVPFDEEEEVSEAPESEETPEASATFVLNDEEVNLDNILDNTVDEISTFCEDKPEEFLLALRQREITRAEEQEKEPRKTLLRKLGGSEAGGEDPEEESGDDSEDDDQLTLSV